MRRLLQQKVIDPIVKLLRQGISPEKLALCMAVGVVIGVFPVIGSTTLLCTVAALFLRLNLPAMQVVNYLVYPLQIALLIPFFHFGAWLFDIEPIPLSGTQLIAMFKSEPGETVLHLWDTTLRAIAAWGLVSLPAAVFLYYLLRLILRRSSRLTADTPASRNPQPLDARQSKG
ncbi:DUF2062 domain-containing protein [Desulfococcus sp.]|uniref:DUF2062 domain-containing protein n=1 Tax=Desulfococcus sp. TaxID=2025834 RepID=UPI003593EB49